MDNIVYEENVIENSSTLDCENDEKSEERNPDKDQLILELRKKIELLEGKPAPQPKVSYMTCLNICIVSILTLEWIKLI